MSAPWEVADKYGSWSVLSSRIVGDKRMVECVCDCGTVREIQAGALKAGRTNSCGCLRKSGDHVTRSERSTPEYRAWEGAKRRCYNTNHRQYKNYGGRGIYMCDEWRRDFRVFLRHIGKKPYGTGWLLDRIDNDRGYEPGNVRWTDHHTSLMNRRKQAIPWLNSAIAYRKNGMSWEKIDAELNLYGDASRRACQKVGVS